MRILILTPGLPFPPHQGTSLRNYHILRGLARHHDLHLLSFQERAHPDPEGALEELRQLCTSVRTVAAPHRTMQERLRRLLFDPRPDMAHRLQSADFDRALVAMLRDGAYDVVQIEGIELANVMPIVHREQPGCAVVFDDHNAEAELQYRAFLTDMRHVTRWPIAAYSLMQWRRLRKYEKWACREADAVTVVSESDRQHLKRLAPALEPTVIPNCIDVVQYRDWSATNAAIPHFDVVFSGKMDYRPNVDAVLWFANEIWPQVRLKRPDATWAIVGQKPHKRLAPLTTMAGVTVTGFVPEVQPYLVGANIYVMPFRMGSGTRLKLIEAMAAGKAIVSTPIGAEGFPVRDGQHLLLADDAASFANVVLSLLSAVERREELSAAASRFAERYDWRRVIPAFEGVYKAIV